MLFIESQIMKVHLRELLIAAY